MQQGYDFEANLERALRMIAQAASRGAQVVVLPEMFITPYEPASIREAATLTTRAAAAMARAASEHRVHLVAGSLPWEAAGGRLYNRACVWDPYGSPCLCYDKIHLFDCAPPGGPAVKESLTIHPGDHIDTFEAPWGTSSVVVCYDIRFTPLMQLLADRGVRVLFVPAAFSLATGQAHWEMLVRMRALELQAFVVGVQPAHNGELGYVPWGHSLVASPWGEVVCGLEGPEDMAVVTLDLDEIDHIRERFPLLRHRRDDLYRTTLRDKT